jgi:hypothetical protein
MAIPTLLNWIAKNDTNLWREVYIWFLRQYLSIKEFCGSS